MYIYIYIDIYIYIYIYVCIYIYTRASVFVYQVEAYGTDVDRECLHYCLRQRAGSSSKTCAKSTFIDIYVHIYISLPAPAGSSSKTCVKPKL